MRNTISSFAAAIAKLWRSRDALNMKHLRLRYLHYLLAFPVSMLMNDMAYKFFDERYPPHGTAGYSYLFAVMAMAAFITIAGFPRKANIFRILWPVTALAGFLVSMLSSDSLVGYIAAMLCWAGMGGCAVCGFFLFLCSKQFRAVCKHIDCSIKYGSECVFV